MSQQDTVTVVFDLDDFAVDHESNCVNYLMEMKTKYPKFRVTLFTILGRWPDLNVLKTLSHFDYIEFAAHGWEHLRNDEVLEWDKKRWFDVLDRYETSGMFAKVWKAPNWEMTRLGYEVLKELGWAASVRQSQINDVPEGMKYYCFESNPFGAHGHTWTMAAHEQEGMFRNWNANTEFEFISGNLETK